MTAERIKALVTAERIKALEDALRNIRELNETGADENGHRWVNSDLIEQEIVFALAAGQPAQPVAVKVRPLVWERHNGGCFTLKSMKSADNGCDVVYYAERANPSGHVVSTVTKPGYFRCVIENRIGANSEFGCIEAAKAAAQADYDARILAALEPQPLTVQDAQCCICGKRGLSTVEDGGPECELNDGRWVCSRSCYETAVDRITVQDAARLVLEWWRQPEPDEGQIVTEAKRVMGVISALSEHGDDGFAAFDAALRSIAEGRA